MMIAVYTLMTLVGLVLLARLMFHMTFFIAVGVSVLLKMNLASTTTLTTVSGLVGLLVFITASYLIFYRHRSAWLSLIL